jgi:hypothetical protein
VADKNIKKSIIKNKDLPLFSGKTGKITLRYRIISEDRNRSSHWSKIHEVAMPIVASPYSYTLSKQKQGNTSVYQIILQWLKPNDYDTIDEKIYDIFLKTNTVSGEPNISDYSYLETQRGFLNVRFLLNQNNVNNFNVIVQRATYDKIININQILVKTTKENLL